jgi:DNA-binding SARP family transcriptional activator
MPPYQSPCVVYSAAAGYGKTRALRAAAPDGALVLGPADIEAVVADPGRPLDLGPRIGHVVVDGLSDLPIAAQRRLAESLGRLESAIRVTLASRRPLSRDVTSRLGRPVVERGASDLALDRDDVSTLLCGEFGIDDPVAADAVFEVTRGWPWLVHLAGEAIGPDRVPIDELLAAISEPGTAGGSWLQGEVVAALDPATRRLLTLLTDLDPVTDDLVRVLLDASDTSATSTGRQSMQSLLGQLGLVAPSIASDQTDCGPVTVVPALAGVLRRPVRPKRHIAGLRTAARWYEAHGEPLAGAKARQASGDRVGCIHLVETRGEEILAAGGAADVVALIADAVTDGSDRLRLIVADAHRTCGDVVSAQRVLTPMVDDPPEDEPARAALSWRWGMIRYVQADYAGTLEACDLARRSGATSDHVRVLACRASALWMLGRQSDAEAEAARGLALAAALDDDAGLGAAHLAGALVSVGARRHEHLARSLAAARRLGDVVTEARVLVNQADLLLIEARYRDAMEVARSAVSAAERGSPPGILVSALHNAGEALTWLGDFDAARAYFERSVDVCRRLGLARSASGLWGLAEIHRHLGQVADGRATYEEVIDLVRDTGEQQVLVPALVGLARLLVVGPAAPADVATARKLATEATRIAPPELMPAALVASGWVAMREDDVEGAGRFAAEAVTLAHRRRCRSALAEALELTAAAESDADAARKTLTEVALIWQQAGAVVAADRVTIKLSRLPGADGVHRSEAMAATKRLLAAGVPGLDQPSLDTGDDLSATVRVWVLGGFDVHVAHEPVSASAWRSRQARSLLKILVSRQGRPLTRSALCELLWPDDDPQRTGHRLSVLLSAVRTVLDPERRWPTDHYVRADLNAVSLDLTHVWVDVEHLLRDTADAAELARAGDPERASGLLAEVEAAYRGEAFEDDPYEEWARDLREEARAAWLQSMRLSAALSRQRGEIDQAATRLIRMLAVDPFDEQAHRELVEVLVAAGRHGEARRAFRRWRAAMRSIEAPLPSAQVLQPQPAARTRRPAVATAG